MHNAHTYVHVELTKYLSEKLCFLSKQQNFKSPRNTLILNIILKIIFVEKAMSVVYLAPFCDSQHVVTT